MLLGRVSSDIWYHFTKEKGKGICRYCNASISMSSGSTSNLKRHLQGKHPLIPLNRQESKEKGKDAVVSKEKGKDAVVDISTTENNESGEPSQKSAEQRSLPVSFSSGKPQSSMTQFIVKRLPIQKSRSIDTQLLTMICREYHPLSIVEDKEFVKFIELLNPSYNLPSRKTLSNSLLPAVYNELLEKVKLDLIDPPTICLTCDGWTSLTNTSFYALTAHFIKNGNLKSYLLEFTERHTGENIADWISGILRKFNIEYKITAIVTDNASNMKAAAANLKLRHLGCFAHTLNLIVQCAITNSIAEVVDKCKTTVQFFKKSSHASSKLREMQIKLGQKELKFKQDVITRWNSTFDMMERLLLSKEAVVSTLALLDATRCTLNANDWETYKESIEVLRTFNDVTIEISSEKPFLFQKLQLYHVC
ncbi:zinc finger BED domain-containing protein 6-like [Wyeomyia smithii]|uniref:zinc finger BED domain-containing protein 6-like n=1 Tax=Wyeomyia smithii TaxID=174621 RepID=UPI002467D778|nr:zinc finger BED domain-containing protein 6-like [Wyeomyia smithii]